MKKLIEAAVDFIKGQKTVQVIVNLEPAIPMKFPRKSKERPAGADAQYLATNADLSAVILRTRSSENGGGADYTPIRLPKKS